MKLSIKIPRRDWMVGEWLLNWTALDTAGTNNGTATNVTYTNTDRGFQKQCWVFWATSTVTSSATFTNIQTLYFRIYPTANIKTLATLVTGTSIISINASSQITTTGLANVSVYVNNTATTQLTLNVWNDVVITCDAKTFSNLSIWSSSYTGNIGRVAFFNRAIYATEIQNWYLEWLRKLGGGSMSGLFDWLVAYYDMRGDANDIVGGNNGTVTGATLTTDRFGFANSAYAFAWSNTYGIDTSTEIIGKVANTVEIGFKINSQPALNTRQVLHQIESGNPSYNMNSLVYRNNGGTYMLSMLNSNDWAYVWDYTITLTPNQYYHACVTVSAYQWTMVLYLNWVQVSTWAHWTWTSSTNFFRRLSIWRYFDGSTFYQSLNWVVDTFRIYTGAKSAVEVKALSDLQSLDKLLPFN